MISREALEGYLRMHPRCAYCGGRVALLVINPGHPNQSWQRCMKHLCPQVTWGAYKISDYNYSRGPLENKDSANALDWVWCPIYENMTEAEAMAYEMFVASLVAQRRLERNQAEAAKDVFPETCHCSNEYDNTCPVHGVPSRSAR